MDFKKFEGEDYNKRGRDLGLIEKVERRRKLDLGKA